MRSLNSFKSFDWRGNGSLGAWMSRRAVNASINYLRDNRKELELERLDTNVLIEPADEPTADDVEHIDTNVIMDFIAQLPTGYRTVFNLHCIEGLPHHEIAQRLGISKNSSTSQLSRAKALLASKIKDYMNNKYEK